MGMKGGYARVSTTGQKLDVQMDRLADCDRIYQEKMSASSAYTRPELQRALDFVRDEDVFIVTKLDQTLTLNIAHPGEPRGVKTTYSPYPFCFIFCATVHL